MVVNYKTSAIDQMSQFVIFISDPIANWEYDDGKGDLGRGGNAKALQMEIK